MDNKFTQELLEVVEKYGYNMTYFSIEHEDNNELNLEVSFVKAQGNRKQSDIMGMTD